MPGPMKVRSSTERLRMLARLRAASSPQPGLCATCRHFEAVESARSVFVKCGLASTDSGFPRYPALPVVECRGWSRADDDANG